MTDVCPYNTVDFHSGSCLQKIQMWICVFFLCRQVQSSFNIVWEKKKAITAVFPTDYILQLQELFIALKSPRFYRGFAHDTQQTYPSISLVCCSERPASLVMMSLSILASNLVQQEQTSRSEWLVLMLITSSCFGILHIYACFEILLLPRITLVF